jgi:hypothetical protein
VQKSGSFLVLLIDEKGAEETPREEVQLGHFVSYFSGAAEPELISRGTFLFHAMV